MISYFKKLASYIFIKFLEQDNISKVLQHAIRKGALNLPKINNDLSPYATTSAQKRGDSANENAIFISSRFRSGSTLLWNLFRQSGVCTSFYEPFNERQWFNRELRGVEVDNSHRGVDDYWSEYDNLAHLNDLYDEEWIRSDLLMTEQSWLPKMKAYIESLISAAPLRPVLQFNRIDFRLPWIKHNFPDAQIIHLYRNPRDQWCSFLLDQKKMNKDDVQDTYVDGFYLDIWCNDLARYYPILDMKHTPHPYQRFYYLWKLSYLHGLKYSNYSLSFEELTEDPKKHISILLNKLNIQNVNVEKLSSIIQAPKSNRWKGYADDSWFKQHENICEENLTLMLGKISPTREE
ncbi:sulfotransferase [Paraglaciecola sp. 25GB23A]|uniref:sulfotransferase n=1 Tax=Paraglaciecola sp. 25GB23A TaxID=3156068 RepID=UPI0032AF2ED0